MNLAVGQFVVEIQTDRPFVALIYQPKPPKHEDMEKCLLALMLYFSFLLVGCATAPQIRVSSTPEGAEIVSKDQVLGKTPITLKKSELEKVLEGNTVPVQIRLQGYEEKSMILKLEGDSSYQFSLQAIDEKSFQNQTFFHHSLRLNQLIRSLLICQGLVFAQKFDEAEKAVKEIQSKYPTVASAYVLEANIYILKEKNDLALTALKKAIDIDPEDPAARRLYERVKNKNGTTPVAEVSK